MPGLLEAHKLTSRAAKVGFDWSDTSGLFDKLEEEAQELKQELKSLPTQIPDASTNTLAAGATGKSIPEALRNRLERELGDMFFVLVNIARHLSLDSESALKKTNRKFRRRFQQMEAQLAKSNRTLQECSNDELEELWQEAKRQEQETA
jgi:nucleoside triphosphate diphosphatase